jgi:hypothetical protein
LHCRFSSRVAAVAVYANDTTRGAKRTTLMCAMQTFIRA